MIDKLVFVYNADSGLFNAVLDSAHKLLSPSNYACSLCALTYHTFGEKKVWKEFRSQTHIDMEFLHKDEFKQLYPSLEYQLPVIFSSSAESTEIVLNHEELNDLGGLNQLIDRLSQKIGTS